MSCLWIVLFMCIANWWRQNLWSRDCVWGGFALGTSWLMRWFRVSRKRLCVHYPSWWGINASFCCFLSFNVWSFDQMMMVSVQKTTRIFTLSRPYKFNDGQAAFALFRFLLMEFGILSVRRKTVEIRTFPSCSWHCSDYWCLSLICNGIAVTLQCWADDVRHCWGKCWYMRTKVIREVQCVFHVVNSTGS